MNGSARHPGKRLSPWRVVIGLLVLLVAVGAGAGVPWYLNSGQVEPQEPAGPRWFGPYFDVTAAHGAAARATDEDVRDRVLLSFIVAEDAGSCVPTWGAAYGLAEAGRQLDLDRRIDHMRREGTHVAVSFGGAINTELALACDTVPKLRTAYDQVLDRYGISTMDLDLEAGNLTDEAAGTRRAAAVAQLQRARERDGDSLDVWVTLPVAVDGLTAEGLQAVRTLLEGGVDLAGVNVMTMDYGIDLQGASMAEAAASALDAVHGQLSALYADLRVPVPGGDTWALIGATPMIGQNDVADEVFTLDDARELSAFAAEKQLARLSMWSVNRDRTCGPNYPDVSVVSDACSGVDQGGTTFAGLLAAGFDADAETPAPQPKEIELVRDDPRTSPYPIWSKELGYSAGIRVVWHGYVYSAKWWVQGGAEPDDPTASADQTSWVLVGPVMADDEPFTLPTAPEGTHPEWDPSTVYEQGARVLYESTPYEAKWWTQGDLPSDGIVDRDRSPWRVIGLPAAE